MVEQYQEEQEYGPPAGGYVIQERIGQEETEQEIEEIEERGESYDDLFDVPASLTEVGDDPFEPPAPMTDEDLRELTNVGGDELFMVDYERDVLGVRKPRVQKPRPTRFVSRPRPYTPPGTIRGVR